MSVSEAARNDSYFPDRLGYYQYVNTSLYINGIDPDFDAARDVFFLLYSRKNPIIGQNLTKDPDVVKATNFNSSLQTRFIIHGWLNDHSFPINSEIKTGYLINGDFNIVSLKNL